MTTTMHPRVQVAYRPMLDVARGVTAGYEAVGLAGVQDADPGLGAGLTGRLSAAHHRGPGGRPDPKPYVEDLTGERTATLAAIALTAFPTLPPNTFLSVPLDVHAATTSPVRAVLLDEPTLAGVVLDLVGPPSAVPGDELERVVDAYRMAGALISIGGHDTPQPELASIVRFSPSIIRLGREWIRGIDASGAKRSAVEVIGQLASRLDAWILAEGVASAAELRALCGLGVPLAQGPFIGSAGAGWADIQPDARVALPTPAAPLAASDGSAGALSSLVQQAFTATDLAAAATVLPETTGYDVVVVLDDHGRPTTLLEFADEAGWDASEVLTVNIDTPASDAVQRAMTRPRPTRFTPLVCTDDAGKFLGILRIERLMGHLADH